MFVDIAHLSDDQTDIAIGMICKAIHDHGDDGIWSPHESPFIQHLIELFTERGLTRFDGFLKEMNGWLDGTYHMPNGAIKAPVPGMMRRWTSAELGLTKLYFENLTTEAWQLYDYELLVEYMVQRYLPEAELRTEAQWLATKSTLMGRVQANLANPTLPDADVILAALPSTVAAALGEFTFSPVQKAVLEFASARCSEYVVDLTDGMRRDLRNVIRDHAETVMLGTGGSSLQTVLLDKFASYNRDWRRIAITEAGNNALLGYISTLALGTKVKRSEVYKNACAYCARINGAIMEVVAPNAMDKNPDTQIWIGKDNYGRSASPRKRVNGELIDRLPEEMWQIPAGLVHPHCRGRWLPVITDAPGDDAAFGDYLRELLS